jgi:hypothetical protein
VFLMSSSDQPGTEPAKSRKTGSQEKHPRGADFVFDTSTTTQPDQPSVAPDHSWETDPYAPHSKALDFIMGAFGVFGLQCVMTAAMLQGMRDLAEFMMLAAGELAFTAFAATFGFVSGRRFISIGYLCAAAIPVLLILLVVGACANMRFP